MKENLKIIPGPGATNTEESQRLASIGQERLVAKDYVNAATMLNAALDSDPSSWYAAINLATACGQQSLWGAALAMAKRAADIRPDDPVAWTNMGLYLTQLQRYDEADEALTKAVAMDPRHLGGRHNLGILRYHQNRADEAVVELREAVALYESAGKPTVNARSDLSHAVMKSGRLHDGLVINEVRWDGMLAKLPAWECGAPRWRGEDLRDKTILVHSEQGYGDAVQFARFLPRLKELGARVIFAVPKPLARLLSDQCGCDEVVDQADVGALVRSGRAADFHSPLLSVVKEIGVEFEDLSENSSPYLRPAPSPAGRRTPSVRGNGFRIGLVWSASPGYQRSRERSVPVDELALLGQVPGTRLYSLQVGPYREDLARTGVGNVVTDLADQIEDFADTVDLARQLDLVVSVDTGPMHAVAAAGVRTWMIQPVSTCWRWARGIEPWYGCAKEYFQRRAGSWQEPIDGMVEDLKRIVG